MLQNFNQQQYTEAPSNDWSPHQSNAASIQTTQGDWGAQPVGTVPMMSSQANGQQVTASLEGGWQTPRGDANGAAYAWHEVRKCDGYSCPALAR